MNMGREMTLNEVNKELANIRAELTKMQEERDHLKKENDSLHSDGMTIYAMMGAQDAKEMKREVAKLKDERDRLAAENAVVVGVLEEVKNALLFRSCSCVKDILPFVEGKISSLSPRTKAVMEVVEAAKRQKKLNDERDGGFNEYKYESACSDTNTATHKLEEL